MVRFIFQFGAASAVFLFSTIAAWYEGSAILDHPLEWRNSTPITQLMNGSVHESSNILQWDFFIYAAKYQFKNGTVKKVLKDTLLSFDQLMERTDKNTKFSGDALTVYGDLIRKKHGKNVLFLSPSFWYPRASQLLFLTESKRDWLTPLSLRTMVPRYFRASEAEERLKSSR